MPKGPEMPELDEKIASSLYSKTDLLKAISEYYNDALPRSGYQEDHFWTNIRIILCIICCAFGVYAQFGTKFPQDRLVLSMCVAGYFAVSGGLAVIDYFIITLSVMCIKIGDESVFLDVSLPTFSEKLTISLRSRRKKESIETSVGHYFDCDGVLRQEHIFTDFIDLVAKYEGKGGGKDPTAKKEK